MHGPILIPLIQRGGDTWRGIPSTLDQQDQML